MLATAVFRAKSPEAFRTISEVAAELDVPQHVLRFWEARFAQIKPVKRAGGRRYYRPEDVDLLRGIRALLYGDGFTIKGVQKILRDKGTRHVAELGRGEAASAPVPFVRLVELAAPSNIIALERAPEPAPPAPVADIAVPVIGPAGGSATLAEPEQVTLEILLAELLRLKARLQAVSRF
ncbi:MAG TPA: MerR family transcriptional regulator [Rhizomicrobium sp.]